MYISRNLGLDGVQKNFSPLGKIFAFVSTMNLTGSVTPFTTKSTAMVTNSRVSVIKTIMTIIVIAFYMKVTIIIIITTHY